MLAGLLGTAWLSGRAGAATGDRVRDSLVKSAMLHKFPSFVEWPEGTFARPDTPLRIGVIGDEEVLAELQGLARDRSRDNRPVIVSRLTAADNLAAFHVLYLGAQAARAELAQNLPPGILTVSDMEDSRVSGSVITFITDDSRVAFGISMSRAARQNLKISSRLLAVARKLP